MTLLSIPTGELANTAAGLTLAAIGLAILLANPTHKLLDRRRRARLEQHRRDVLLEAAKGLELEAETEVARLGGDDRVNSSAALNNWVGAFRESARILRDEAGEPRLYRGSIRSEPRRAGKATRRRQHLHRPARIINSP